MRNKRRLKRKTRNLEIHSFFRVSLSRGRQRHLLSTSCCRGHIHPMKPPCEYRKKGTTVVGDSTLWQLDWRDGNPGNFSFQRGGKNNDTKKREKKKWFPLKLLVRSQQFALAKKREKKEDSQTSSFWKCWLKDLYQELRTELVSKIFLLKSFNWILI